MTIDLERIAMQRADEQTARDAVFSSIAGKINSGERHHSAKIDRETAEEIVERAKSWTDGNGVLHAGESKRALAREYGVDEKLIRKICNGEIWRSTAAENA